MRLALIVFAAVLAVAAPAAAQDERPAVAAVLDQLHAAAAGAEGEAYFELFTPDATYIGTDVGERWTLAQFKAYAMPYFDKGRGWSYSARSRAVTIAPIDCRCVAWFEEVLDSASYGTARGSGVLRLTSEGWKIEQYVLSFPVPNDVADDVIATIKAHEAKAASK